MMLYFNVSRRFGFVAFHNYVPSSVTTMVSWISFWIKKESAPARTSLGITSVLTMTTLGTFSRKNFPRVSYITALDFYIAICFVFCFCALMEFAVLNFLTYNRTAPRGSPILRHPRATIRVRIPVTEHPEAFVCDVEDSEEDESGESEEDEGPSCPAQQAARPSRLRRSAGCSRWCDKYCCMVPTCDASSWQQGRLFIHVYRLDNYSRVIFPVTFFFFNVIYWLVCLNL